MPSLESLRLTLAQQGFQVSEWRDLPGTVYPAHSNTNRQVRCIVRGRMRVGLPEAGQEITLEAGDTLELEPNESYWADVDGVQPVVYLIGIKNGTR